jgi:dTDP-4-dehydrorhamnose reductase
LKLINPRGKVSMINIRLLILGANGFIGSTLFQKSKQLGFFDLTGTSRKRMVHPNMVKLDVTNKDELHRTISRAKPDVIIWSLMDQENEMMLIENGLKNLLDLIDKETKLFYVSTDAFFTGGNGNYKETNTLEPTIFESTKVSNYAKAKLKGEFLIHEKHPNHLIIRTGPLYGVDGNHKIEKRTESVLKLLNNNQCKIKISANLLKTFVHVEDFANAILELCLKKSQGIIHLGPLTKESYYTFYQKRLRQLGYDSESICPNLDDHPQDTSLNTQFACSILDTEFRAL